MTSEHRPEEAYVWVWLPAALTPVVAGRLSRQQGDVLAFNYGRSYLARPDAMPLYAPELPLRPGLIPLLPGLMMPNCIRDAAPDAWGRRVLVHRLLGMKGQAAAADLDELTCLLESGSDRAGALDFQVSATRYLPRRPGHASLAELLRASEMVEQGVPLSRELSEALQHGTSLGGARPKALIEAGARTYIAKFSSRTDHYNVVKAEFVAMRLAARVGLDVAPVRLETALDRDVLLVERFDRVRVDGGWHRRAMVSALTLLALDEMMAAHASYEDLAEIIRHRFVDAKAALRELFGRIVFNILCGNTDDHARNHAAFWTGRDLALTPAYDICPQSRTGGEASQGMLIHGRDRRAQVAVPIAAAPLFLLNTAEAIAIVNDQVDVIVRDWDAVCAEGALTPAERLYLWQRQFLNPFAFEGAPDGVRAPF